MGGGLGIGECCMGECCDEKNPLGDPRIAILLFRFSVFIGGVEVLLPRFHEWLMGGM